MTGLAGHGVGWPWWRLGMAGLDGGLLVLLAVAITMVARFHEAAAKLRREASDLLAALTAAETTLGRAMSALAASSQELTAQSETIDEAILTFGRHLTRGEGLRREIAHMLPLAERVLARIGAIVETARQPQAIDAVAMARPSLVTESRPARVPAVAPNPMADTGHAESFRHDPGLAELPLPHEAWREPHPTTPPGVPTGAAERPPMTSSNAAPDSTSASLPRATTMPYAAAPGLRGPGPEMPRLRSQAERDLQAFLAAFGSAP